MGPSNAPVREQFEARTSAKSPSGSVHSAIGFHPPARSNVRASRGPYLRLFSVWIVSPSAIENDSPATVNSIVADGLEVHLDARLVVVPESDDGEMPPRASFPVIRDLYGESG